MSIDTMAELLLANEAVKRISGFLYFDESNPLPGFKEYEISEMWQYLGRLRQCISEMYNARIKE